MRVRDPNEPTTYVSAVSRGRGRKFRSQSTTVYGITPEKVMEILRAALVQAANQEMQVRRTQPVA